MNAGNAGAEPACKPTKPVKSTPGITKIGSNAALFCARRCRRQQPRPLRRDLPVFAGLQLIEGPLTSHRRPEAIGPFSTKPVHRCLLNGRRLSGLPKRTWNGRDGRAMLPRPAVTAEWPVVAEAANALRSTNDVIWSAVAGRSWDIAVGPAPLSKRRLSAERRTF